MKQNDYRYHICIPNDSSVRVQIWNPDTQILNESSGTLNGDKLEQVQDILSNSGNLKGDAIQKVGEVLFDFLFDNQLRDDFLEYYREIVERKQQRLQVILEINETAMPEIVAYPWELMCFPQRYHRGNIRLATDPKLSFFRSRYNLEEEDKPSIQLKLNEKLKIALVVARPTADSELKNVEYQQLQSDLTTLANQQQTIEFLPTINPATPKKVAEQLKEGKPDIFHFIGHGQLGQVAFVTDSGEADWKKASFFGTLFTQHRPKVVILQACETGKQSETDAFSSVASRLMLQGVPVVIAMQYQVSNHTARSFATDFYQEIVKGSSVDVAVQQARFNLALDKGYEDKDFATPVIYLNASDGKLFPQKVSEVTEQQMLQFLQLTDELKKKLREEIETRLSEDKLKSIFLENEQKFGKNFYNQIPGSDYRTRVTNTIRELNNRNYIALFIAVIRQDIPLFARDFLD